MKKISLSLFLLLVAHCMLHAQIRYVKEGGTGDGSSWAQASGDLQSQIYAAAPASEQVWVAAGSYQRGVGIAFVMQEGVKIYGGFPNSGSPTMSNRNWITNVTTLIGNNNVVVYNTNETSVSPLTAAAEINGFTITGGIENDGAGIYNVQSSPTIANCTITGNTAREKGGGIFNDRASPVITNCTISGNTAASRGAGIYNLNSSPVITNCLISGNSAQNSTLEFAYAGGVYSETSSPTFINCTVSGNKAKTDQDGLLFNSCSSVKIFNTIVLGNSFSESNTATLDIQYSLIEGRTSTTNGNVDATGKTTADVFVNPQAPGLSAAGNYRLIASSGVIDIGNNAFNTQPGDLSYNNRVANGTIDFGAYESNATALPIKLGGFTALLKNGQLVVYFTTLSETNNSHFDIEVSTDGVTFAKAATLKSQHTNGNSSQSTDYTTTITKPAGAAYLGLSIACILSVIALGCNRKNKLMALSVLLITGIGMNAASCKKQQDTVNYNKAETLYVRIAQVDKDGSVHYTKAIQAVREND